LILTGEDLVEHWLADLAGPAPVLWSLGEPLLSHIEIGPGRLVVLGGAPNAGKSAVLLWWVVELLRHNDDLRVVILNAEMPTRLLLDRIVARLSGVRATELHRNQVAPGDKRLVEAMRTLRRISDRLAFVENPSRDLVDSLPQVAGFSPHLLVVDYLQRFTVGNVESPRERVNLLMEELRGVCASGRAVLAAAALSRAPSGKGYDASHLSLASFRESSELEYNADDALLLHRVETADDGDPALLMLRHVKSRYSCTRDVSLRFYRTTMRFEVVCDDVVVPRASTGNRGTRRGEVEADVQAAWRGGSF
jgi:replicative DNA helicase